MPVGSGAAGNDESGSGIVCIGGIGFLLGLVVLYAVEGVCDEVECDLAYFSLEAGDGVCGAIAAVDGDVAIEDAVAEE